MSLRHSVLSIHRQLLQLKAGNRLLGLGICNNLRCIRSKSAQIKFNDAILSWPSRRGEGYLFPVEGNQRGYSQSSYDLTLWKNPRRLALLDYLIEYYKPRK